MHSPPKEIDIDDLEEAWFGTANPNENLKKENFEETKEQPLIEEIPLNSLDKENSVNKEYSGI